VIVCVCDVELVNVVLKEPEPILSLMSLLPRDRLDNTGWYEHQRCCNEGFEAAYYWIERQPAIAPIRHNTKSPLARSPYVRLSVGISMKPNLSCF